MTDDQRISKIESRLDAHSKKYDSLVEDKYLLIQAVEKLGIIEEQNQTILQGVQDHVKEHDERIRQLEMKPLQDVETMRRSAFAAVGSAIGVAIIAVIAAVIVWTA